MLRPPLLHIFLRLASGCRGVDESHGQQANDGHVAKAGMNKLIIHEHVDHHGDGQQAQADGPPNGQLLRRVLADGLVDPFQAKDSCQITILHTLTIRI